LILAEFIFTLFAGTTKAVTFIRRVWQEVLSDVEITLPMQVFSNDRIGTFTESAEAWGVETARRMRGAAAADYDRDGFFDLLLSAVDSAAELERFVDLNRPGSGRSDALVFVDISLDDTAAQAFVNAGVCAVSVGTTSSAFSSVTVDNVAVGRAATQLLLDHGHRRIGLLSLRVGDSPNLSVPQQRAEGYAQAHSAAGLAADSRLQRATSNRWADARAAAHELLSAAEPPSAIFAMCDEQAFGVMLAARDLGLRIPECLSVVGVDDHDQSELAGLTTVRQHVAAQGTAAAELVLRALDTADPSPAHWRLDTDLVVRRTVGPPHSA